MASVSSPRSRRSSLKHLSPLPSIPRSLNRKTSNISFKSDNDKPYTPDDDYSSFTAPYSASSSRHHQPSYKPNRDAYQSPILNGWIDDASKHRKHQYKSSVISVTSLKDDLRAKERNGKGKEKETRSAHGHYEFADLQADAAPYSNGQVTPKSRTRTRPSTTSSLYDHSHISSFRDSGSSSLTQIETPPHTPVDDLLSFRGSMERISVFASVSGVEVMDAMVDGMNGFGADDHFFSKSLMSRRTSKAEKAGFHPLYQPPLPTPPPGVRLGGGVARKDSESLTKDSDEDDEEQKLEPFPFPHSQGRRKGRRPHSSRSASSSTSTRPPQQRHADIHFPKVNPSIHEIIQKYAPASKNKKAVTPASEIIRSFDSAQTSSNSQSSRQVSLDDGEPVMVPLTAEEEAEFLPRSSVDSVTEEVRNTIQNHVQSPLTSQPIQGARSFVNGQSVYSDSVVDMSIRSPRSETGHEPSIYSFSAASEPQHPVNFDIGTGSYKPPSASQAIAQYLRSVRLTTLLKLTCAPHASRDNPLTVSLSDLGSPTGFPLVVFLGLGCVRHVMGLYDEMAECLGLRLITIDRWGLGRTQVPPSKLARGIPEWSSVVAEVLDLLGIEKCSIMAHSAGAPYALAFANQYRHRICGDIFLLAPWVGEGAGYKWLKYVPNGILKTAQAAEWKIQTWMLGKPPTISYEGIGFDLQAPPTSPGSASSPATSSRTSPIYSRQDTLILPSENKPRPSIGSSVFSDYDDLRDFDGRFESRSTVGGKSMESTRPRYVSDGQNGGKAMRKLSKSFLGKLRGAPSSQPTSPPPDKPPPTGPVKRLKALKSMSSLKSKASSAPSTITRANSSPKPELPQTLIIEVGLGLDEINWGGSRTPSPLKRARMIDEHPPSSFPRANGNRSMSFGAHRSSPPALPPSPSPISGPSSPVDVTGGSYQAMLGNALIAASHAESAKGTHSDLVQILNHDRVPWGFSYSDYPHEIRVWYGDKDEKIAESAVRWLERTMGPSRCHVNVVKGADHALMYKSAVVIDMFEQVHDYARYD